MFIVLFHVFYLFGKFVYCRLSNNNNDDQVKEDNDAEADFQNLPFSERSFAIMEESKNAAIEPIQVTEHSASTTGLKRRYSGDDSHEEAKATIKFSPPAYIQRYQAVLDVLTDSRYRGQLKKIVDFGCAELSFCKYLKRMVGVEEALFVDIDRDLLEQYKDRASPLHVDYLHRRTTPLTFKILQGSVAEPDKLLEECDAVVCIELIEHLYPDPLDYLPQNIFGYIKPKVAIITTPNADFNVLFNNMSGFRHPDHKFEWTRKQFQDWANNVILRYPDYEVSFHGICNGPSGTEELGACSQMAVFHKTCDLNIEKVPGIEGLYKPVEIYEYPFEIDNRSDEQKILDDAVYYIHKLSMNADLSDDLAEEVPLQSVLNLMDNFFISINDLREVLQNNNWAVADRENGLVVLVPPESTFSNPSMNDDNDYLDNDLAPDDWNAEACPDEDFENNENWEDDGSDVAVPFSQPVNVNENKKWLDENWESHHQVLCTGISNSNICTTDVVIPEEADSTTSIQPDDMCLDDIIIESRSTELANSAADNSILIPSFSETKGSENSDSSNNCSSEMQVSSMDITENQTADISTTFFSAQSETKSESSYNNFTDLSSNKSTSICSMFLEPSNLSNDLKPDNSTDTLLECTFRSPAEEKINKKQKYEDYKSTDNINERNFEDPKFTSSPHIPAFVNKKRKITKQRDESSNSSSLSSSSENLMSCLNDTSDNVLALNGIKIDDSNICSNESVIVESNTYSEYSTQTNNSASPEKIRHYTGTIPKNISVKISDLKVNVQKETKLERITPETPESLPHSWSPEVMDSGYPNSNSPPDLSPEYDLSSIAHDHSSGSESPSLADVPRNGYFDFAEVQNRDLANNNLDNEGNNVEAERNQHINDLRPLINVLENDLENENDIYVVRNGFPIWLLGMLQRFDAEGIGLNLPRFQPPNENFGG